MRDFTGEVRSRKAVATFAGARVERPAVAAFSVRRRQLLYVGGSSEMMILIFFFPVLERQSSHRSPSMHIGTLLPSWSVENELQLGVCSLGVSNASLWLFGTTIVSGQSEFGAPQEPFEDGGGTYGQAMPPSEESRHLDLAFDECALADFTLVDGFE